MKRVERRQLKGDEFVSGMGAAMDFLKRWKKEAFIFVGVLAILTMAFLGAAALRNQAIKKESRKVGEIAALRADANKNPENLTKLERLAGKGKFSRLAYIELATAAMEKGDWDKAEKWAVQVKPAPRDLLYYQSQDLLASIAVKKKDFAKALEIYDRIEKEKPECYPLDAVLFHKGQTLELKGDGQAALAVFKKLQDEYNQTYYGYEASQKLSRLQKQTSSRP